MGGARTLLKPGAEVTVGGVPERLHPGSSVTPPPQISEAADWLKIERTQVR